MVNSEFGKIVTLVNISKTSQPEGNSELCRSGLSEGAPVGLKQQFHFPQFDIFYFLHIDF